MKAEPRRSTRKPAQTILVLLLTVLALGMTACGEDDDADVSSGTTTTSSTSTTVATTTTLAPTTTVPATTTSTPGATTTAAPGGTASVSVTVDGEEVPLQRVCRGVDGAVVAIATSGRRIILVREEGLALRIGTEGDTFAETDAVETTPAGQGTRYEGTILVEGQPTRVTMEIASETGLEPC